MSGKCLSHSSDEMGKLMLEALTTCRLDRKDRIEHFLRESISSHSSSMVSSGHRYAGSLLGAERSKGGWLRELWSGITAFQSAKILNQSIANDPSFFALLHAELEELRSLVLAAPLSGNALVSSTGDSETLKYVEGALSHVLSGISDAGKRSSIASSSQQVPTTTSSRFGREWTAGTDKNVQSASSFFDVAGVRLPATPRTALSYNTSSNTSSTSAIGINDVERPIALVVPTQVNYCVRAATLPTNNSRIASIPTGRPGGFSSSIPDDSSVTTSFSLSGSDDVVSSLLRTGYLWEKVRVQGGAYGGFCSLSDTSSSLSFASYRDPRLDETLNTFDRAAAYLAENASSPAFAEDLRKGIISSIGGIDAPMSPSERGATSTGRYISGVTDDMLQTRRKETLSTSTSDAVDLSRRIAEAWEAKGESSTVRTCVVGSETAVAASQRKDWVVVKPLQGGGGGGGGGGK